MLEEVLRYLHNWFYSPEEIRVSNYTIEDGEISLPFLLSGQYFRIVGSVLNDGVYQYPCTGLNDESFYGAIWPMKIPPALLSLVKEIEDWQDEYGSSAGAVGPYQSESFGGYSYTKASSSSGDSDSTSAVTWLDTYSDRLIAWRKIG